MTGKKIVLLPMLVAAICAGQNTLPPRAAPLGVPAPGPSTDAPYAPLPILPGGVVLTLYPPDSPYLNKEKVRQAEQNNMSQAVPGRINSIVNIHNPSIEVHLAAENMNTGTAVIVAPGGGHTSLVIGLESASKPRPSSSMTAEACPGDRWRTTLTRLAAACLSTFVSDS